MDNQPQPPGAFPLAPTTTTETPPQPAPSTGRSDLQHMYPQVGTAPVARTESARNIQDQMQADATMSFYDAIAAVAGIASYLLYPLMLNMENTWVVIGFMAAVAATGIVFAYMGYRASKRMSPLGVIGVAASTMTLLYVLNICLTYMLLKSGASYFSPWSGL